MFLAVAIPVEQRPDGEAMPEVVRARPGMIAAVPQRTPKADSGCNASAPSPTKPVSVETFSSMPSQA
jgi:hypothetical protein